MRKYICINLCINHSIHMYTCLYVYIYLHTQTHTHTHTHIHVNVQMDVCICLDGVRCIVLGASAIHTNRQ